MFIFGRLLLFFIRCYQLFISPLLPSSCRFIPSCSTYGIEAIKELGPIRGGWLIIKRLLKCHPFSKYGYDPVPKRDN